MKNITILLQKYEFNNTYNINAIIHYKSNI
jgi:hypothetical protein